MRTATTRRSGVRGCRGQLPAVAWAAWIVALTHAAPVAASYGIYVGKNLTADGSVFLAGYGDEPSSHWLEIVPRRQHPEGTTITVGCTDAARMPGQILKIPQAPVTFKYITM